MIKMTISRDQSGENYIGNMKLQPLRNTAGYYTTVIYFRIWTVSRAHITLAPSFNPVPYYTLTQFSTY